MNCDSPSDLVQISARGVSNYTYCPRLFYLQWVERIFVANSDTVEGAHLHRRVDEPTLVGAEDSDAPKILRSIALDDPELGLTGVLDVAEESEEGIVIVDYKKGAARRTEHGRAAKDYDSAQGITQVLLAEANGYKVQSATIYYAADRRRVPVDISDDARHRTLETIKAARQCVMDGHLPPPLIHDVRCDHCSAYPVCLPTESHRWRQGEINGDEAPSADPQPEEETTRQNRSLRPPLAEEDNREVLVVQTAGAQVGLRSGELLVSLKGEVIRKLPCKQVRAIYIFGPAQPTTQALTACLEEGVNISYFSRAGSFIGMTVSTRTTGVTARAGQYRICGSELIALPFARQCVAAKIHNQRVILLRNSDSAELSIRQLSELKRRALTASSLATLRGIEGAAAATYFGQFSSMLTTQAQRFFDFTRRNRRPPRDPVNALLSLGYSLLAKELTGVLYSVGLDPYYGFFHQPKYGKPALALDLMEEFRPIIVDSVVITLLNRGDLTPDDFVHTTRGVFLKDSSRRIFWDAWFRRLDTLVTHPVFKYQMAYRRMFEIQCRYLWRCFMGEAPSYKGFTTR